MASPGYQNDLRQQLRQAKPLYRASSLEPASSAVPTPASDKQHYDDDDQESCGVHIVLQVAVRQIKTRGSDLGQRTVIDSVMLFPSRPRKLKQTLLILVGFGVAVLAQIAVAVATRAGSN